MSTAADRRRRWAGAIFLGIALGMLVVGQTLLRNRLGPKAYLVYWLACFIFTGLAMLTALLDYAAIRRSARAEQREFLDETIKTIARGRPPRSERGRQKPGPGTG
ncbi:MAG: hypothetical protein U1F98_05870 [Verrucomicrobiota bacterium]